MCPLSRLPARYVFGRRALDTAGVAMALAEVVLSTADQASSLKQVVIFLEHALSHHSDALHQQVSEIIAEKNSEKVRRFPHLRIFVALCMMRSSMTSYLSQRMDFCSKNNLGSAGYFALPGVCCFEWVQC